MHAGIYIHIPFCVSRCSYCDFATGRYTAVRASRYISSLIAEIDSWCELESFPSVDTIYFGGGTPSLLLPEQLERILLTVKRKFQVDPHAEITLEMNPGNAGTPQSDYIERKDVLCRFREAGINRVSFGAQTFNDSELARLGRSHNTQQLRQTLTDLRQTGFRNISFDLIAGLPGQSIADWQYNLDEALAMRPAHLSFYLLEVHEGTPLADHIRRGIQPPPDDDLAGEMYRLIVARAEAAGYEHYEISNLCLPGFASRHNTKYWTGAPYFGFGCSSHSFDGARRRWSNERAVDAYMELVEGGRSPVVERQLLNDNEERAESIFLGLRMMRGISLSHYREKHKIDLLSHYSHDLAQFSNAGLITVEGDVLRLTVSGALVSNEVFSAFL